MVLEICKSVAYCAKILCYILPNSTLKSILPEFGHLLKKLSQLEQKNIGGTFFQGCYSPFLSHYNKSNNINCEKYSSLILILNSGL